MNSLLHNYTWNMVELQMVQDYSSVSGYSRRKLHTDDNIKKYKARLVTKGFSHKASIFRYLRFNLSYHNHQNTYYLVSYSKTCEASYEKRFIASDTRNEVCKICKSLCKSLCTVTSFEALA